MDVTATLTVEDVSRVARGASDVEAGRKLKQAALKDAPPNTKSDVAAPERPVSFYQMFRYAKGMDMMMMLVGLTGAVVTGLVQPAICVIFGELINVIGDPTADMQSEINKKVLLQVYCAIIAFVVAYTECAMLAWTGGRQAMALRKAYLRSMLRQDVAWFDTKAGTGKALQALNEDTQAFQVVISERMGAFTRSMANFVGGLAVAFWKGWDMTLVILSLMPFLVGVGIAISTITGKLQTLVNNANQGSNNQALQTFGNVRTVFAYGLEEPSAKKYEDSLGAPEKAGIKQAVLNSLTLALTSGVMFFAYGLALWYGAREVADGDYTGGKVITVLMTGVTAGFALGQAMPHLQYFTRGRIAAASLYSTIRRKPTISIDTPGTILPDLRGDIELDGVTFAYPARPDRKVFDNFSLAIPAGKTVALVGESGSGKSTIVQLLERFYDPNAGQVLLDGHDLKSLQLGWLRSQISLVSQEPALFNTTIYDNIANSKPDAKPEEVIAAATAANAHGFISRLPNGYDTPVGEGGTQLSGGQRQRIAIARAILRNPKILLLDEATSALDAQSEAVVQQALENLMGGRTTIVIAHRLSTIVNADIIAVVRRGTVVEQGCHTELLKNKGGFYSQLVAHQQLTASEDGGGGEGDDATGKGVKSKKKMRDSVLKRASVRLSVIPAHIMGKLKGRAAEQSATAEETVPMSRLLQLNKPEWGYGVFGAAASAGLGFQSPGFSMALAGIVSVFFNPDPDVIRSGGTKWGLIFVGIGLATILLSVIQGWCFGVMGQRLARRVRQLLFRAILRQDVGWFDQEDNNSGQLVGRLSSDAVAIRGAVGDQIGFIVQNVSCVIASYVIALYSSWQLALVVTSVLPLLVAAQYVHVRLITGQFSSENEAAGKANQVAAEAMSSIRVVAAYGLQDTISSRYGEGVDGGNSALRSAQLQGIACGFAQFMVYGVTCLAFWYGGRQVSSGSLSFADMLRAFFAINFLASSISQAYVQFPDMGKAKDAVQRVFGTIDRTPAIDAERGAEMPIEGDIMLKDVTFAYPARPGRLIFKQFNLHIPAGTSCALVGESGHGKSTIIGLVQRFYEAVEGQVLLDGVPIQNLSARYLRTQIGLVGQEPVMFDGSILDNIQMGNPHAPMSKVIDAARAANALDFIERLPEQMDTKLGAGGIKLSGGQKQRIAIARAVLRDPKILMLDEATSALDAESETIVQQALDRLMASRTTIVVAHRLSTIRNCTKIAAVYRGRVLEEGTYDELMQLDRYFAYLVAASSGQ